MSAFLFVLLICPLLSSSVPLYRSSDQMFGQDQPFLRMKCTNRTTLYKVLSPACKDYLSRHSTTTTTAVPISSTSTIAPSPTTMTTQAAGMGEGLKIFLGLFTALATIYSATVALLKFYFKYGIKRSLRLSYNGGRNRSFETSAPELPVPLE